MKKIAVYNPDTGRIRWVINCVDEVADNQRTLPGHKNVDVSHISTIHPNRHRLQAVDGVLVAVPLEALK